MFIFEFVYKNYNSPEVILNMKLNKIIDFYYLAKEKEDEKMVYDLWLIQLQQSENPKTLNEFKKSLYDNEPEGVYIDQINF